VRSLIERAGGSLAVKALPALYGVGLVLLVIRAIPLADFGRYAMAMAYVNIVAVLAQGLWDTPLIIWEARGERRAMLAPAFWLSAMTALVGGGLGFIILPLLGVGWKLSALAAAMLLILVPRDVSASLMQGSGRVWGAFLIEAGYFVGSLAGFAVLAGLGRLTSAEVAMAVNVAAGVLSAAVGLILEPGILRPGWHGDWKGIFHLGRWVGLLTLGGIFLQQGDALIVGAFFTAEAIAPYLAARTLLRVYALASQAVIFFVLPGASRHRANQQIARLRRRLKVVLIGLTAALVPINVVAWFLGPVVFPLVLGAKYVPAIPFFRLLILATFFEPPFSILMSALCGFGKPQVGIPVLALGLALYVCLNFALLPIVGLWAAPAVLVGTYAVLAAGFLWMAKRHLRE